MKKLNVIIALVFFTIITFSACKKEEQVNFKTESPEISYDNNHDMMIFASMDILNKHLAAINKGEQVLQTDKNFISLSEILDKVVKAETALSDKYEELYKDKDLSEKEIKTIKKKLDSKPLEKITKQFIDKGIIKMIKTDSSTHFDLTTCAPYYANFLNEEGMMKVGDTIYKYSANQIKRITDGDFNKIPLLKNLTISNTDSNIDVINVKTTTSNNKVQQFEFYTNRWITGYGKAIIVTAFFNEYTYNGKKKYIYNLKFYCQKKVWWWWKDDTNAEVYVKDYLQVKKNGTIVLNNSAGVYVYHNTSCYQDNVRVYEDGYSNDYRQFSANSVLWTRSGSSDGFSYNGYYAHSVNW